MNNVRTLAIGFIMVLATMAGGSATAHAETHMLVLIDASGSMTTPRPLDPINTTRFAAAKERARSQILSQALLGLDRVAVYTFSGSTSTLQTAGGFVDPNVARAVILGLNLFAVGGGSTPLAGSLCDAVDTLVLDELADTKILKLYSDGEENTTPLGHPCQGPSSTTGPPVYSNGSWQQLVTNYVVDHGIPVDVDLLNATPIISLAAPAFTDPEAELTAKARLTTATDSINAGDKPPTLEEFFDQLARVSGGRLTLVNDDARKLPVFADANNNSCVDRSDAILVARAFGQSGPPQDNPLDLNLDGQVSFADYLVAVRSFSLGGCGIADPYVARAPLVCKGGGGVVIDGQAIENGGLTIDARGSCEITIKNSLIVSGQNAITVVGKARITIDNSIIVGQDAVIVQHGGGVLSVGTSILHGKTNFDGSLQVIDRGGNIFE